MEEQYNFLVTREEKMGAVVRAGNYREARDLACKLPAQCYVSIGCLPHYSADDIIDEDSAATDYGIGYVYTAAEIKSGICSSEHDKRPTERTKLSEKQKADALQCLIDNGIDKDESETVLQALCYILLNTEIEN